jgi:hypothetical protein
MANDSYPSLWHTLIKQIAMQVILNIDNYDLFVNHPISKNQICFNQIT